MPRRTHHSRSKEPPELNITAFLNLMVVLVPFLLITAVFSQITILQLNIPAAAAADNKKKKQINIEVIVRQNRLELGDGHRTIKRINNNEEGYDIRRLSKLLINIKKSNPEKRDATILVEPDIEYDVVVKVMDAVGGAEIKQEDTLLKRVELFPQISIGDAPRSGKRKGKKKG